MIIRIEYDADTDLWNLMASVPGMSDTPAGPRIFRAPPHPQVEFSHQTQQGAEADAEKIRTYLANLPVKKISKKEIQGHPV